MPYSDEQLYECVVEIDSTASSVTDREAGFIEDIIDREQRKFSPRQRQWIEDMIVKYLP